MRAALEFAKALGDLFFNFNFMALGYLLYAGIRFQFRILHHKLLKGSKCRKCGGHSTLYFMRSKQVILGLGSDDDLFDWIICDTCREAVWL